jgi:type III pantothenate kinase
MLLAIDAGNTNIVFALFEGETQRHVWRCQTDGKMTADEYHSFLHPLFLRAGLEFSAVSGAIISCVVPDTLPHLKKLCAQTFGGEAFVADYDSVPIEVKLARPDQVGADRLMNAYAVARFHRSPAIVVDFGTAATFDVIDETGAFCGGVIAPGPNLSREALFMAAARLPRVGIERPKNVIGQDTIEAMQSGLYYGYAAMAEGIIARLKKEIGGNPLVIATGGLSGLFAKDIPSIQQYEPELMLRGLVELYRRHNRKAAA